MDLLVIIKILTVHWIADFILQSDKMAKNKSKSLKYLSLHILVYMLPLFIFGWKFAVVNAVLHFCVDFITSKITSHLYAKGDVHNFFVIVGLDQLIHTITLLSTYQYLVLR